MTKARRYRWWSMMFMIFFSVTSYASQVIDLGEFQAGTVGKHIQFFQELDGQALSLEQAMARFESQQVRVGSGNSISLGIGVAPVWLKFSVQRPQNVQQKYQLFVETPWLDVIDSWVVHGTKVLGPIRGGDGTPFEQRPMQHRFYGYEVTFEPGLSEVYLRIETLGPMAIPVRLSTVQATQQREVSSAYEYGLLYGVMAALSLYNLVLFIIIRQREYGLYSLYLLGFIVNSLSYTGQIHGVFTPQYGPYFQDWVDAFLMITYSVAGLHFARYLLNTRRYAPGLDRFTFWVATSIPLAMLVSALLNQLVLTLILAFILNSGFALLFIVLGVKAVQAGTPSAWLFLVSSVTAAVCIAISTMAVGGIVPYNDFTFKLIEMGMAFEAIFLAVILAQRFRMAQRDKIIAETYARTDPLTHLKNRRGFKEVADQLWQTQVRKNRDVAVVLLDIDHFKNINDSFGHAQGDLVLKKIARCIENTARKGDVSARWGGEEFILFLPETDQQEAAVQAERIRQAIQSEKIGYDKGQMQVTASFGVAGRLLHQKRDTAANDFDLETLIREADNALYMAKNDGRNCVHTAPSQLVNKTIQMGF